MANTPAIYWSGANLSDYSTVPTKEIQSVMDMVTRMADKMNGGQLAVIYTKVKHTLLIVQADWELFALITLVKGRQRRSVRNRFRSSHQVNGSSTLSEITVQHGPVSKSCSRHAI